ncbi:CoA ester lyase [Sphingosinicella sp. BN140058]|uniref:HpcH/HpaI aldolase/citrate lyase family protein n=1 Tax=Sphingosinicella sp. BN140058 TaxID=1892855 RepID=UPI00101145A5|nr:CoA ester lyase [Sphingosinicella sp. BN140058]QAY79185.1 CoA ester lyase [Sphingosinicella sp. BN140058]
MPTDLRLCRSLLFLPASNPRAIEKARGLDADMIFLDLEDAVKPESKSEAREAAVQAATAGFGGRPVAIRVNKIGDPWHAEDVAAVSSSAADAMIVPKVQSAAELQSIRSGKPVLAMIETASGVIDAAAIARRTAGLIAGTNDLAADLGLPPGAGRRGLAYALQAIVVAARAAETVAFDGVYNRLEDDAGLVAECEEGRAFGFDGKTLIHPNQIDAANRIFGPGVEEIDAARRLIAAATGGAERFEGRMIEGMHVAQAERLLARARLAG